MCSRFITILVYISGRHKVRNSKSYDFFKNHCNIYELDKFRAQLVEKAKKVE